MSINLRQSPYYDDYDKEKGYTKILAVPGRVEQSREFTQIQSMVQEQIKDLFGSIYTDGKVLTGCLLSINSTKTEAYISKGSIFAYGRVWNFLDISTIPITGVGTEVIGIHLQEEIITEQDDSTLLDPAAGYTNYMQPGAHRLKQEMVWSVITDSGLGIFTLVNGALPSNIPTTSDPKEVPQTQQILDIIAQRDYERNGNYVIDGLKIDLVEHPTEKWDKKRLVVGHGVASIRGYDVTLQSDWYDDFLIARDSSTIENEPYTFATYNPYTKVGAQKLLSERPVAAANDITASVLAVDGYGLRPHVTRGAVLGGSDELSESNIESILEINQSGTWDPANETFVGGTTFGTSTYILDGNSISWSPLGAEPDGGTSYQVAYKYRKTLDLQIMEMTSITNESRTHDDSGGNYLTHRYTCESNFYTEVSIFGTDSPSTTPKYILGTDFILDEGQVDWYSHDIQVIQMLRSGSSVDNIAGFINDYVMGEIIAVGYYSNPASMSFDEDSGEFITPDATYTETSDWTYSIGINQINWSPDGAEPAEGATYFIACKARKYLTDNHPVESASYYMTYSYWNLKVAGDYLARNSFYINYDGPGATTNITQHYGLDLENSVNFWRSYNHLNNPYNMDKPYPGSLVEIEYDYYLPRYAIINLDPNIGIVIRYGNSSINPVEPRSDQNDTTLDIAEIYCPADSLYVYKREYGVRALRVNDLHNILDRTIKTEQRLALTWLDLQAKQLPVPNKKGILTLSFTTNEKLDPGWPGTTYSIDPDWEQLALPHTDSFYSTTIDTSSSYTQKYATISTLVPNGETSIEQPYYTNHESIAPYALINQNDLEKAQSAYMLLNPSSDTLIIPRTQTFSSETDAESWINSDLSKLTNPTQWFNKGWSGGTERRNVVINSQTVTQDIPSTTQYETFTSDYIRDIQGDCRQIQVTFSVPGGLIPASQASGLDYLIYFGDRPVTPTLTNNTPAGATSGSFRARETDHGADGYFTIPPGVPEGRIEVRITSTPITTVVGTWRHTVLGTFDSAVVEKITLQYTQCRCNCFCYADQVCWVCRGRCGTGPLAETLEPVGRKRFLKSVDLDFYKVHPNYGVYACIIKTDNGQPTSNTVSTGMIARKYLPPSTLAGGGMKTFVFDDPILQLDQAYAIVATGEDGFNLNSLNEVAAGRDIQCKIAKLGEVDIPSGTIVGSQPFKSGVLWRSLTGVSWEQDQTSDLKFKATYYTYPVNNEQIVYMNPISVTNATAFICNWNSTQIEGTKIIFEYRTQNGLWTEFTPYKLTYLSEIATSIRIRARLSSTSSDVTPFIENNAAFYVQSNETSLKIVTNLFPVDDDCDTLDVWVDAHLPSGASQDIKVSFDDGVSWTDLDQPLNGSPNGNLVSITLVNANENNVTYQYHWQILLIAPTVFSEFRVQINGSVIGSGARLKDPRFSNLIAIASSSV